MNETIQMVLQVVVKLAEQYVAETPSTTDDMVVSLFKSLLNGFITQTEGVAAGEFEAAIEQLPEGMQAHVEQAVRELQAAN